jgi:hypothetical protein
VWFQAGRITAGLLFTLLKNARKRKVSGGVVGVLLRRIAAWLFGDTINQLSRVGRERKGAERLNRRQVYKNIYQQDYAERRDYPIGNGEWRAAVRISAGR